MSGDKSELSFMGAHLARLFDWLDARGRMGVPLLAFVIGLLLSRAFAPSNIFPALFISFPLMVALIDRAGSGRQALVYGWWVGFGLFAMGISWVGYSFTQQDAVPAALAPFAIMLLAAGMALYVAITFWVARKLWCRGTLRILVFACVWTLFEIARGLFLTGFPWLLAGSAWGEWLWVAQASHYLSVYGLSFVTVLVAASTACLLEAAPWKRAALLPAAAFVLFTLMTVAGYMRLAGAETHYHLGLTMRLVQANVPQKEKWISYLIEDHFDRHMTLSRANDPEGKANGIRLLIWPETAVQRETFDRDGSIQRWRMSKLLDYGSFAITGAPRYRHFDDGYRYYNSLFAINSDADLYARYDKVHLVPFGEFLPFEKTLNALGLTQLTGGVSFSSGRAAQTIRLPGIPGFSPLICYEAVFPGEVVDPRDRPEWLLNISNDAWFGHTEGPYQHLALARFRAIEEGLPLVRSTSTGVSAVIDAYGRTVSQMPVGRQGVLDSPLPKAIAASGISTAARIVLLAMLVSFVLLARTIYLWRGDGR